MRPGDAHDHRAPDRLGERLGATDYRKAECARALELEVLFGHGAGDDDCPCALDVLGIVTGDDLDAEPREIRGVFRMQVTPGDTPPSERKGLCERAHAPASYANPAGGTLVPQLEPGVS